MIRLIFVLFATVTFAGLLLAFWPGGAKTLITISDYHLSWRQMFMAGFFGFGMFVGMK